MDALLNYAVAVADAVALMGQADNAMKIADTDVYLFVDGHLGAWERADRYLTRAGGDLARAEARLGRAGREIDLAVIDYSNVAGGRSAVAAHFRSEVKRLNTKLTKLQRKLDEYRDEIGWEAP